MREMLKRVKALLATPDKWCKRASFDYSKNMCLAQAVWVATERDAQDFQRVMGILGKHVSGVAFWNDHHRTTFEDVHALLDRCIEECGNNV